MIAASGAQVALRSLEELPTARTDIYVADTMGELGLFYRLAPIVFMGGSLVPHGGQNPIEAVKLNASIVHGPHVFNFTDVYDALDRAGGACRVDDGDALTKQLGYLLNDSAARDRRGGGRGSGGGTARRRAGSHAGRARAVSSAVAAGTTERPMREPAFWNRPSSLLSRLLMPVGALYGAIAARRLARTGLRAGVPVICVGNYHVGGAGKTPTVLALAGILRSIGETPVVLSRGYGGRLDGPVRVDPHRACGRRCRR